MKEVPNEEIYVGLKNFENVRAGLSNLICLFRMMELDGFADNYKKMYDEVCRNKETFYLYYEILEKK